MRSRGFDFGDFEITKREILASISIIAVMLLIGFTISGRISNYILDRNEKYNKAIKIESSDLFEYGMKSNIELSDKERRRIIRRSVESQPWKLKCTIAMEEFAELTQAISKQIRGYDNRIGLLEEMADAYICLEFLKSIFNITPEELQKAMDVKLQRERNKQR